MSGRFSIPSSCGLLNFIERGETFVCEFVCVCACVCARACVCVCMYMVLRLWHTHERRRCGFCQLLAAEWEKVAANLKHMIYIGAVDTERSPVVAGSHFDDANPIQGVPTIKLFIPTGKKGRPKVVAYNGERKAKAIVAFLTQHMPNHVTVLRDSDASHDRFLNDKTKPKVVRLPF